MVRVGFRIAILLVGVIISWFSVGRAHASSQQQEFGIADYFHLRRVVELAISATGGYVAYVVESPSLQQDSTIRKIFFQSLELGSTPFQIEGVDDARALQWIGHGRQLAFISPRSGSFQIYTIDVSSRALRQWSQSVDPVISFRFSAGGDQVAYLTQRLPDDSKSVAARLRTGQQGVLLDSNVVSVLDFLESGASTQYASIWSAMKPPRLWTARGTGAPKQVQVPGEVRDFFWSPDDRLLSVTYVDQNIPQKIQRSEFTSIAIVKVHSDEVSLLLGGRAPGDTRDGAGIGYVGGEWVPNRSSVFVRRKIKMDPWLREHYPDWTTASVLAGSPIDQLSWHPMDDIGAKFQIVNSNLILVENKQRGVQSLFRMDPAGSRPSDIVESITGSSSLFAFDRDLSRVAFVNESLTRPPEIYVWEKHHHRVRQVSNLNLEVAVKRMPRTRKVTWRSKDGTQVEGWLMEPSATPTTGPRPLVTYVHGGPGMQFLDQFAYNFPMWPYPLEVLPAYNISVFIPNYRGTHGYGVAFSSPSAVDVEPVDDILTGIEQLISDGVADRERLGIAGHSHGGWLAPLVMTRAKLFKAGSFAEGFSNWVALYDLNADVLNHNVDVINGVSLWDDPRHYLDMSPDLHLSGVPTASLIETGALTLSPVFMIPLAKAARHFGLPAETFVYPRTDHNVTSPQIQSESAERNLDWFRFWLLGQRDADSSKAEQYARWDDMATISSAPKRTAKDVR